MAIPPQFTVTEGAPGGFNPKCNQSTITGETLSGIRSAAEVAAQAQARHAERRAEDEAYRRAKEVGKMQSSAHRKRRFSRMDIT